VAGAPESKHANGSAAGAAEDGEAAIDARIGGSLAESACVDGEVTDAMGLESAHVNSEGADSAAEDEAGVDTRVASKPEGMGLAEDDSGLISVLDDPRAFSGSQSLVSVSGTCTLNFCFFFRTSFSFDSDCLVH
jgi:hypothetical protein